MELKDLKGLGPKTLAKFNNYGINNLNDLILLEPKKYISYNLNKEIKFDLGLYYVTEINIAKITKMKNSSVMIIFIAKLFNKKYRFIIFGKEYLVYMLNKYKELYLYARYELEKNYFNVNKIFNNKPNEIKVIYNFKDINDSLITKLIKEAFPYFKAPNERLPQDIVLKYKLITYDKYLILKHFPNNDDDLKQIYRRQIYEKFFWRSFFYALLKIRNNKSKEKKEFSLIKITEFINKLPFKLTIDQEKVINIILEELQSEKRINRLVEGDVGSGKTIVALIASLATMLSNNKVVMLAPTIILATQHYNLAKKYLNDVYLLTSNIKEKEKKAIIQEINNEKPLLLIATHSILYSDINITNLGLIIIDEQQRFGVIQRSYLQKKYPKCDTLYFTATPIPRSLAMTCYGGLDLSEIKTKPEGRKEVKTKLITDSQIPKLKDFLKEHLAKGEQVFIVCSQIKDEENDLWDLDKASLEFGDLGYEMAKISGKLKDKEKVEIMNKFKNKEINILIATTVIEVGIDIKDATILVLLDATRYGLATIHQLRGRVGRGDKKSYFFLVSKSLNNERLKILETINDGFTLAEYDLKYRGPGEFLSHMQSGFIDNDLTELEKKIYKYANDDAKMFAIEVANSNSDDKYNKILEEISTKDYENN